MTNEEKRIALGLTLKQILGTNNVFFQTKPNNKIYPRILYSLSRVSKEFADNRPYMMNRAYMITLVTQSPDDGITDKLDELPMCLFDRHYISDGGHHYVYTIYI